MLTKSESMMLILQVGRRPVYECDDLYEILFGLSYHSHAEIHLLETLTF